jgi:hypothetical protein
MSAALTFRIAVAITRGAILTTTGWSVGRYRVAREAADCHRFACLDHEGTPCAAYEMWGEPYLLRGGVYSDEIYGQDWSAFGAARVFVLLAGPELAQAAVDRLEDGAATRLPVEVASCT